MATVLPGHVRAVIQTEKEDSELQTFIDIAETLYAAHLGSSGLSEGVKFEIERHLAAHFLADHQKGIHQSLEVGDVVERFSEPQERFLLNTKWGQTAVLFDTTGTLKGLSSKYGPARIRVVPAPDSVLFPQSD